MTATLRDRWDRFLITFFGVSNQLDPATGGDALTAFLDANEVRLGADEPGPFVLPCSQSGLTTYYAIALDDGQAQELRRVLAGVIGPTYTDLDGRSVEPEFGDQVLASAIELAGSPRRVFRFSVPGSQGSHKAAVRRQVLQALALFDQRPVRRVNTIVPFGRLVRDFELAIADGERLTAESILFGPIKTAGELSGANLLFLHVRLLACFEDWQQLQALPGLSDVIRMRRPALVSDSLAQFALRGPSGSPADIEVDLERFAQEIGPAFGALIPTVESIRSEAGAEYYTLWYLSTGASVETVVGQLRDLRWGGLDRVLRHLAKATDLPEVPKPVDEASVLHAFRLGQFDVVLDMLTRVDPTIRLVPVMLSVVPPVFTSRALDLMSRFRTTLGDVAFDAAIAEVDGILEVQQPTEADRLSTWSDRLIAVADGSHPVGDLRT